MPNIKSIINAMQAKKRSMDIPTFGEFFENSEGRRPTNEELIQFTRERENLNRASDQKSFLPKQATQTKENIFSLYGFSQPKDIYSFYGVDKPRYKEPDLSQENSLVAKYQPQYNPSEFENMLNQELKSIKSKYDIERKRAREAAENERKSTISGLYNVGVVNPLSSGVQSINSAMDKRLSDRLAKIDMAEAAERNLAQQRIFGMKTKAQQQALNYALNERQRAEQRSLYDYNRQLTDLKNSMGMVENAVDAIVSGKRLDKQQKDDVWNRINWMLANFGSQAFEGVKASDLALMEAAAGLPAGSLQKGLMTIREQELKAKKTGQKPLLKSVGGDLYQITFDNSGNAVPKLIIRKRTQKTVSKTPRMSNKFKKWYYETFKDYAFENNPKAAAEWERWRASGKEAKQNARWIDLGGYKALVDTEGNVIKKLKKTAQDQLKSIANMSDEELIDLLNKL